jgi:hypothetical protein
MTLFVFKNDNENHSSIAVKAKDIFAAMEDIRTNWFPHYFDYDFSVIIVQGTSGVGQ